VIMNIIQLKALKMESRMILESVGYGDIFNGKSYRL
jgi:hypothetical protein